MMNQLEMRYEEIATSMVSSIPGEWSEAWIVADILSDNVISMKGVFRYGKKETSFRVDAQVARLFRDIRSRMARDTSSQWTKARFLLKSDGEFTLDLTY